MRFLDLYCFYIYHICRAQNFADQITNNLDLVLCNWNMGMCSGTCNVSSMSKYVGIEETKKLEYEVDCRNDGYVVMISIPLYARLIE